jgi:hypothetical protein
MHVNRRGMTRNKQRKAKNEYLFSKIAGTVRRVEDLIIENREVECKAQPYGVSWCQLSKCDILCGHENLN